MPQEEAPSVVLEIENRRPAGGVSNSKMSGKFYGLTINRYRSEPSLIIDNTFTFSLNLSGSIGPDTKAPGRSRQPMARILLAETDLHIRRFVSGILSDCGHAVESCADSIEAASSLATRAIDIVITDLVFEFGGDTPLARACAARGIPTLTLSGGGLQSPQRAAEPPSGLREKPFRFGYLERVIDAVAGQPGPGRSDKPQPSAGGSASDQPRRA